MELIKGHLKTKSKSGQDRVIATLSFRVQNAKKGRTFSYEILKVRMFRILLNQKCRDFEKAKKGHKYVILGLAILPDDCCTN